MILKYINFVNSIKLYNKHLIKRIIEYIFPTKCNICNVLIQPNGVLCPACWIKLDFISDPKCIKCSIPFDFELFYQNKCINCESDPPLYNSAYALLKFNEYSKKIIHWIKYGDNMILGNKFAQIMYINFKEQINSCDIIIPVPMHKIKRMFRMYNQASILANKVSALSKIRVINNLLIKSKWTKSQTYLGRKERKNNIHNTIKVIDPKNILRYKKIALIDDVLTTGVTASVCAQELKNNGAKEVLLFCIARA